MLRNTKMLVGMVCLVGFIAGTGIAWAAFATTTTSAGSVSTATLAAPTSLTATGSVNLSWTATTSTVATGTRVFRATVSGGPYTQIAQIVGLATTTYTDSPGAGTFYYVVESYYSGNGANWTSANSNQVTASGTAPITLIQATTGGGTGGTFSATFTATPVAGDLLIAVAATRSDGTIVGPAGWSTAITGNGNSTYPDQTIFYKLAGAVEPTTVTITTTATGSGNGLQLYEYRGVTTLANTGSTTGTGTVVSAGSVTTTTARALIVGGLTTKQGNSFTAGSWTNGFAEQNNFTQGAGGSRTLFGGATRTVSTTGTYTTAATSNTSGNWRGQIVAFT